MPPCPECNALRACACRTEAGNVREPHRARQQVIDGSIVVVRVEDARRRKKLRALLQLAATINRE
jgi:hypothetical protein